MAKTQRIRDTLHNLIEFDGRELDKAAWEVIQSAPFQRLRRVKQLGFSEIVYPGATHSRLAHSIGVFHTARKLMRIVERHLGPQEFSQTNANKALIAALVHDVGHGPMSHAFEEFGDLHGLKLAHHEDVSDALIQQSEISEVLQRHFGEGFAKDVAKIVNRKGPIDVYDTVVSSQFDADRLDYMQRDRLMCGTLHGVIDFEWLISNLHIGKVVFGEDDVKVDDVDTLVLGPKAIYAAEAYVLGLFQLYPTVYFHKTTRAAEKIYTQLLDRIFQLVKDGKAANVGIQADHPIVEFCKQPDDLKNALRLDDAVIHGALPLLENAKDPVVSELASRLRVRKLLKAIDLRVELAAVVDSKDEKQREARLDAMCDSIQAEIDNWPKGKTNDGAKRILTDKVTRSAYKEFQESKGPLNQIRIRPGPGSDCVDLREVSAVVKAIGTFKVHRVYVRPDDKDARKFVEQLLEREKSNAKK